VRARQQHGDAAAAARSFSFSLSATLQASVRGMHVLNKVHKPVDRKSRLPFLRTGAFSANL